MGLLLRFCFFLFLMPCTSPTFFALPLFVVFYFETSLFHSRMSRMFLPHIDSDDESERGGV